MPAMMDGKGRSYTGSMIEYRSMLIPLKDTDKGLPTGKDKFRIQ
jgi:hypothetical protein